MFIRTIVRITVFVITFVILTLALFVCQNNFRIFDVGEKLLTKHYTYENDEDQNYYMATFAVLIDPNCSNQFSYSDDILKGGVLVAEMKSLYEIKQLEKDACEYSYDIFSEESGILYPEWVMGIRSIVDGEKYVTLKIWASGPRFWLTTTHYLIRSKHEIKIKYVDFYNGSYFVLLSVFLMLFIIIVISWRVQMYVVKHWFRKESAK